MEKIKNKVKGMKRKTYSKVVDLRSRKIRKKRQILLPLTVLFLCLAVLCILGYARDDIYIAKESTVKEIISSEAVIVKNEKVINAPAEGKLELLVKAGERVRVNAPLFKVVADVDKKQVLEKEMDELRMKLENVKKAWPLEKDSGLQSEAAAEVIEKSIELQEKKLQEIESTVFSPMAGMVSFNIDGYENLLVPDKISCLDYEDIEDIKDNKGNRIFPEIVKVNQAVLKIVDNLSLNIVTQWNGESLKLGWKYILKFPQLGFEVKAELKELCESGKTAVFSAKEVPFELLDERKVSVEIVARAYKGIGVPVSAIINDNGQEGVLLFFDGRLIFKPVKVVACDDKIAIVEGVKLGDRVIVKRGLIWSLLGRT